MAKISSKELREFLEENLSNYDLFIQKLMDEELRKNKNRKSKWSEGKMETAVKKLWHQMADNIYDRLKVASSSVNKDIFTFINENSILESIDESLTEVNFDE